MVNEKQTKLFKDYINCDLESDFVKKLFCFLVMCVCLCSFVYASEIDKSGETLLTGATENVIDSANTSDLSSELSEYEQSPTYTYKTLRGTVIEAGEAYEESAGYATFKYQNVKVYIKDQGYTTTKLIKYSVSFYSDMKVTNPVLKEGDKVYVYTTFEDGKIVDAEISYRNNTRYLVAIVVIYALAIVLIGGAKGVKALISLIFTVLAVFYIIIPQIISGANPMLVTILTSILITVVTLFIISGFNKKAIAAILGTTGGILIAGIFAVLFGNMMALSGVTEDARLLEGLMESVTFDFKGILFSGIIIGALGACMDVSMSIASALHELKEESPNLSVGKMIKAGMNIGKDMMGTMTNTLILAYTGGSIVLILVFMKLDLQFYEIINQEMMIEEVLRAIAGSFGLVVTIPFTTVVTSLLMGKRK